MPNDVRTQTPEKVPPSIRWIALGLTAAAFVCAVLFIAKCLWVPGITRRHLLACLVGLYFVPWGLYGMLSARSPTGKALRFMLATGGIFLAVFTVELPALAGLFDYRRVLQFSTQEVEENRRLNLLDPELLQIHRPHFRDRGRTNGGGIAAVFYYPPLASYEWDIRYDHHGFRNREDYGSAEVIVIGDSFIEGVNVRDQEQLLTSHLARALQRTVVNLGQTHYGPQQELVVLKRYGLPLKPKVCVWAFFEGNDLLGAEHYERNVQRWGAVIANSQRFSSRSFLANLTTNLTTAIDARFRAAYNDTSRVIGTVNLPGGRTSPMYFFYEGRALAARDLANLARTKEVLQSASDVCRAHDIAFVVMFVPTTYRVYHDHSSFPQDSPIREWIINDLPERVGQAVASISPSIPYLDLTPALRVAAPTTELLYYPDDTDWTPEGHRVAGEALADFLKQQVAAGLLEPGKGRSDPLTPRRQSPF